MLTFSEAELQAWITPLLWPFLRALALFTSLPVLGQRVVPVRVRIALAFFIAVAAQATLPAMPAVALDSMAALLLAAQQVLVGLALGFAGPWMMTTLVEYLQRTLQSLPSVVG